MGADRSRRATTSPPVRVDVITYAPTVFFHCQHCELAFGQTGIGDRIHREQARASLPDDLQAEFAGVADWVHGLVERHGSRVRIRVIDAVSLQGFLRSLRKSLRQGRAYPAVVVDGTERFVGPELALAELEIERRVAARPTRAPGDRGTGPTRSDS